ncbi:copper chaperone NosL [Pontibacter ummariensis]|uniref:Copper chaperone NosL n=1 Tax=Pontibacter ummariensis TaxID=1610492 RepID=A0A239LFQ3_9BACT|nr:nitrous oxide reductase accessory protein NosL [Pontibacter ummariensis]PRY03377.1 copper chaperone NosL [Pontibacter ummariensis]SNT29301.1 copper chaperone NosL [Pontibacter ummariensis]
MKKKLNLLFALMGLLLLACEVAPQEIVYGQVNCAHCNMTVSDSRYGAELVSSKGKAFMFDSAECLAAYLIDNPEKKQDAAFVLVTDFAKPNTLIDVKNAAFLQSENLPSPMGLFLTAFADKNTAGQFQQKHKGRLLSWEEAVLAVQNDEKPF